MFAQMLVLQQTDEAWKPISLNIVCVWLVFHLALKLGAKQRGAITAASDIAHCIAIAIISCQDVR